MKRAIVRVEIQFEKNVPRKVLEDIVTGFTDMKEDILKPLRKDDPNVRMRVWYDRLENPEVRSTELISKPKIRGFREMFRRR